MLWGSSEGSDDFMTSKRGASYGRYVETSSCLQTLEIIRLEELTGIQKREEGKPGIFATLNGSVEGSNQPHPE